MGDLRVHAGQNGGLNLNGGGIFRSSAVYLEHVPEKLQTFRTRICIKKRSKPSPQARDHARRAGAIGLIFGAEMVGEQRLFRLNTRQQRWNQGGDEQQAEA